MSYVKYSLMNVTSLGQMAAAGIGQVNAGQNNLPPTPGLYVIFNEAADNRYVGKAKNFNKRFGDRLRAVNELGLQQANLARLDAFYGQVTCYDSLQQAPAPLPAPGVIPFAGGQAAQPFAVLPEALAGGAWAFPEGFGPAPIRPTGRQCQAPDYVANLVTTHIDGVLVNVEALLIRYFFEVGFGGSMTNSQFSTQFTNTSRHQMDVMVEWCAGTSTSVGPGHREIQIPSGAYL